MANPEHDWLDERLAEQPYLADGGFTERVVTHLPQSAAEPTGRRRRGILAGSGFCALAVAITLAMVDFPSLVQGQAPVALGSPFTHAAGHFAYWVHQPKVLYGGVAMVMVSALGILPFLRRWV